MISGVEGRLTAMTDGRAHVQCGAITYELLVPACDHQRLAANVGETIAFRTLHYLEGSGQGASYTPRLIGFVDDEQRAFFELFTTVKGVGNRKALRTLALPFSSVAEAIAAKDVDLLKSLPEIGKRTAETIITELHDKVGRFIEFTPGGAGGAGEARTDAQSALMHDAAAVLAQLGEPQLQARHLVERALAADPTIDTPDALVAAAYRLKELA
jgi:Holliday junction DNA helicase RuvA